MAITTTQVIASANDLLASHSALVHRIRLNQQGNRRQLHNLKPLPHEILRLPLIPSPPSSRAASPDDSPPSSPLSAKSDTQSAGRSDLPLAKRARVAKYKNYVPEEETIRNDYSQRYVDGGEWPQNWVLGAEPERRFEEYPKQQRLLNLKKASVNAHSLPPFYLSFADLSSLQPNKFDVILLDPPFSSVFTWDHLQELPIPALAADPSFVFLWVGSGAGEGLERGREVLAKWGYRRCEDVVWVKTNKTTNHGPGTDAPTTSLLTRTKQHCLIGIRGTVRRSTDSWFVHCNVDTDVIIWEGDPSDPTRKPPETYTLIENFCLGTRRLEVFGKAASSLRRGWVTVFGPEQEAKLVAARGSASFHVDGPEGGLATRWTRATWENGIKELANGGKPVVPLTSDIDALRPKSPFRPGQTSQPGSGSGVVPGTNNLLGNTGASVPVNMGIPMSGVRFNPAASRTGTGFVTNNPTPGPTQGQNQMMVQPMMGVGMGMNAMAMGMGVDNMMGPWPGMMGGMGNMNNIGGMGSMNAGGMASMNSGGMNNMNASGMGGITAGAMGNMNAAGVGGMNGGGIGNMNVPGMSIPMMGPMSMGAAFQGGDGFVPVPAMFGNGMGNPGLAWGEQGQFGMDGSWDASGMMNVGVNGMTGGMNMGMGQWGRNGGTF